MGEPAKKYNSSEENSEKSVKLSSVENSTASSGPTDSEWLKGYFINVEEDKFSKLKITRGKHWIRLETDQVAYKFLNEGTHHSLDMNLCYSQNDQNDLILLQFIYVNRDGGYPNMGNMDLYLIPDDGEPIILNEVTYNQHDAFTLKGWDNSYYNEYREFSNLKFPVSDFIKVVNAKKVEFSIRFNGGRSDGVLKEAELVQWMGFYNNIFDDEFEADYLINFLQTNKVQLSDNRGSSSCYIATLCYGDENHESVVKLRKFRDNVLCKYLLGKIFINFYYKNSPLLCKLLVTRNGVNSIVKNCLESFVKHLR